jgi:hypothetical protein
MSRGFARLLLGLSVCALLGSGGLSVLAQSSAVDVAADAVVPTAEQVTAGKRVWVDAACYNCHGPNGQGGRSKDFPHGPSLRLSELDPETTLAIIACGIPGTQMPGWAKGAYTERPCFGETGPVPEGARVIGAYDEQQLSDLLAYIFVTFRNTSP